jgi:hypothetical protein
VSADGAHYHDIPHKGTGKMVLEIIPNAEYSTKKRQVYANQVASVSNSDSTAEIILQGNNVPLTTPGKLALSTTGCVNVSTSTKAVFQNAESDSTELVYQVDASGFTAGTVYDMCYCEQGDARMATTSSASCAAARRKSSGGLISSADDANFDSNNKDYNDYTYKAQCESGCIGGDNCKSCKDFDGVQNVMNGVEGLCLDLEETAISYCSQHTDCHMITRVTGTGIYFFHKNAPSGDVASEKHEIIRDCNTTAGQTGFQQAFCGDSDYARNIGKLHVTDRFDVGANYVLTASKDQVIEVTGTASWSSLAYDEAFS